MTREDFIKQAYAHGASIALQELGFNPQQANSAGVKLAEEQALEKTAISGGEAKAAIEKLLASVRSGAGQVGGAASRAGGAMAGAGKAVGEGAMGAGRAVGGAGKAVGNEAQQLMAALSGGMPYQSMAAFTPQQLTRTARGSMGAGLLGGAGLGAGGMALGNALGE